MAVLLLGAAIFISPSVLANGMKPDDPGWPIEAFWKATISNNEIKAVKMLEAAAKRGFSSAQCLLAHFLFTGVILPPEGQGPDYKRIFSLLNKVPFEDCLDKPLYLAVMYREGLGTPVDLKLAGHYFRKEAVFFFPGDSNLKIEKALDKAKVGLIKQFDVKDDFLKADRWWREISVNRSADELYKLSLNYLAGRFVSRDKDLGFRLLQLAAKKGSMSAAKRLQQSIFNGDTKAFMPDWYLYVTKQTNMWGRYKLIDKPIPHKLMGLSFIGKSGIMHEPLRAYALLLAAELGGAEGVSTVLSNLEKKISPAVASAAKKWVRHGMWVHP